LCTLPTGVPPFIANAEIGDGDGPESMVTSHGGSSLSFDERKNTQHVKKKKKGSREEEE
jgi:hypothetical protein